MSYENKRNPNILIIGASVILAAVTLLSACNSVKNEVYERTEIGYYYGSGITKIEEAKYNAAASNLTEGLKHHGNSGLYTLRGFTYCKLGKFQKAIDDFNLALKYKKSEGYDIASINRHLSKIKFYKTDFIFANRALAYSYLEEFEKAFEDINRVIQDESKESLWYCYRAQIHLNKMDYDGALQDLAKAIELKPKNASAYRIRAEVYEALGDEKSANEDIKAQKILDYEEEADITKYNIR